MGAIGITVKNLCFVVIEFILIVLEIAISIIGMMRVNHIWAQAVVGVLGILSIIFTAKLFLNAMNNCLSLRKIQNYAGLLARGRMC